MTTYTQRLQQLASVDRRANHRDFDNRYGSNTKHPAGTQRAPYGIVVPKRRKYQVNVWDEFIVVGLCLIIGFVLVLVG